MDLLSRLVALAAPFVPVVVTNWDKRVLFVPVARPGTKGHPLLSRPGVPGWETRTTEVSQPGQISVSVVVLLASSLQKSEQKFVFPMDPCTRSSKLDTRFFLGFA